jgi:hypothetical protein
MATAAPWTVASEVAKRLNIYPATLYSCVNSDESLEDAGKRFRNSAPCGCLMDSLGQSPPEDLHPSRLFLAHHKISCDIILSEKY